MADLLSPITDSEPAGEDLSFSTEFDAIQEMRRADDPTLDQGEWVTTLKTADWEGVVKQCDALLQKRTKDLRLLAWRVEALAQCEGYPGLAQGLQDLLQVCERFWDPLHPQPDGTDMEQRAGTLRWLLRQLEQLARSLPVTDAATGRFTLTDIEEARQLQIQNERDPENAATRSEGKVTQQQVQRARNDTPAAKLRANVQALEAAQAHLNALQGLMDTKLGDDAPGFVQARQKLDDALHSVKRIAVEAGAMGSSDAAGAGHGPSATEAGAAGGSAHAELAAADAPGAQVNAAAGALRTRGDALQQLRRVADFFRRTEPHSPVALLVDKAVRWGEMPLDAWLREVVKDQASLAHLEELLGMKPKAEE